MTTEAKTYKRDRTIYVIGDVAFVANPATRRAWWKTHAAVAFVACPDCRAAIGQLCGLSFGFHRGNTHAARRRAARPLMPGTPSTAMRIIVDEGKIAP